MRFQNSTFHGQRLPLDNNEFINCRIEDCTLVYGGGPLHMVGNILSGVRWEFTDGAARTLQLLASFYQMGDEARALAEGILNEIRSGIAADQEPTLFDAPESALIGSR